MLSQSHTFSSSHPGLGRGLGSLSSSQTKPLGRRGLQRHQLGTPDQPDPLLNVVSQTSPQGFQSDLRQSSQAELTQADFSVNPSVGKFSHLGPLFVNGLGRFGSHL